MSWVLPSHVQQVEHSHRGGSLLEHNHVIGVYDQFQRVGPAPKAAGQVGIGQVVDLAVNVLFQIQRCDHVVLGNEKDHIFHVQQKLVGLDDL